MELVKVKVNMNIKLTSAIFAAIPAAAIAAVPLRWTVETSRLTPATFDVVRGESLALEATLNSYGKPLQIMGNACLCWQTNGMGSAWWTADATVAETNRIRATWLPEYDAGAAVVHGFLGQTGSNFRAAFSLRFRNGPGATPNALPLPVPTIDCAKVTFLHPESAPFGGGGGGGGCDTNAVDTLIARYDETNLTARINAMTNRLEATWSEEDEEWLVEDYTYFSGIEVEDVILADEGICIPVYDDENDKTDFVGLGGKGLGKEFANNPDTAVYIEFPSTDRIDFTGSNYSRDVSPLIIDGTPVITAGSLTNRFDGYITNAFASGTLINPTNIVRKSVFEEFGTAGTIGKMFIWNYGSLDMRYGAEYAEKAKDALCADSCDVATKARGISLTDPVRNCNWYQAVTNGVFFWNVED